MNFGDEFKDMSVIVTGSSGGIGKETALRFAKEGAKVAVCDVKIEAGRRVAEEIKESGHTAFFAELDVTDPGMAENVVKKTTDDFGGIDVLVNCAGVSGNGFRNLSKIEDAEWDRAYQVNLKGTANCCRSVFGIFRKQKHGRIINVASVAGRMPTPGLTHYAASKAAVINLTQSLASEMARYNVNVNAVCPGWIWTPIYSQSRAMRDYAEKLGTTPREAFVSMVESLCPLKREQTEEDIANVILFLSSRVSKNITGQSINVDGGAVMS
ncbi:MAG: SDR family oxidoreductase [Desulfobacteraceae bacterium]|nr:SDR family oxidoreductase [Desulfobacteraceae bacterium]